MSLPLLPFNVSAPVPPVMLKPLPEATRPKSMVTLLLSAAKLPLLTSELLMVALVAVNPEIPVALAVLPAVILRILFTLITTYLLMITGLRLIGGILLLYICYKLYVDVIKGQIEKKDIKVDNSSYSKAIFTIIMADVTMSLDNVLSVAGAAKGHFMLLIFGLALSIALMAFAANLIARLIEKYKWIGWLGLLAILVVAIDLIYTDLKLIL